MSIWLWIVAAIVALIAFRIIRVRLEDRRINRLRRKWEIALEDATYQFKYVEYGDLLDAPRPTTPHGPIVTTPWFITYLAIHRLAEKGIDPSGLTLEECKEELKKQEEEIELEKIHRSRELYKSIIQRARDILEDPEGRFTVGQKKAAERVYLLSTYYLCEKIYELTKGLGHDINALFRWLGCEALKDEDLEPLFISPDSSIEDVFLMQTEAAKLATEYDVKLRDVYRILVIAQGGNLAKALNVVDECLRSQGFYHVEGSLNSESCEKLKEEIFPFLMWEIAGHDLTLQQAMVLSKVFDLKLKEVEMEIADVELRLGVLKEAQSRQLKVEGAKQELEKAKEVALRHFIKIRGFRAVSLVSGIYGTSKERSWPRVVDIQEQENARSVSYLLWERTVSLFARLFEDDIAMVQKIYEKHGTPEVKIFLLGVSCHKPVVRWEIASMEIREPLDASLSAQTKGAERIIQVKLEGVEGDEKSACIVCNADSSELISVGANGFKRDALHYAAKEYAEWYWQKEAITWQRLVEHIEDAHNRADTMAEEMDFKKFHETVYGISGEVMEARRQRLMSVHEENLVDALDPVIFTDDEVVNSLMPDGKIFEMLRRIVALHQPIRKEILQGVMRFFRAALYEELEKTERYYTSKYWQEHLREGIRTNLSKVLQSAFDTWTDEYKKILSESEKRLSREVKSEFSKALKPFLYIAIKETSEYEAAAKNLARCLLKGNSEMRKVMVEALQKFGFVVAEKQLSVFLGGWFGRGVNQLAISLQMQLEEQQPEGFSGKNRKLEEFL